jgi:uncharacterized protein (TIGR00299 family) protein
MKVLVFDPIPGASGDMILAALIDCGIPQKYLRDRLSFIPGFTMNVRRVTTHGVCGRQVTFKINRSINESRFLPLIKKSSLSPWAKKHAVAIIERIFAVEQRIHRTKKLHLHELADADTLLDVCGALVAIEYYGIDRIVSRPLKAGRGFITTAEGRMPAFNFATACLLKGAPVDFMDIPAELTTPTGAAIISTMATFTDSLSLAQVDHIGMGVGTMTIQDHPNCLRVFIGSQGTFLSDTCTVYETNIDDMVPQDYEEVVERLYRAGALEVMITPTIMKKNRPGILLTVICQDIQSTIKTILLRHTTTLGIRMYETKRWKLRRTYKQVVTPIGKVGVKIAWIENEMHFTIEYKDMVRIARERKRAIPEIRMELTQYVREKLTKSSKNGR